MFKFIKTTTVIAGCVTSLALSGQARAEQFQFDPGMGDPTQPNFAGGDGKPYDWYYQGITLDYLDGFIDGHMNGSYQVDASGNYPYFTFDGTDLSRAGHCLQVVFGPPNSDSMSAYAVQALRFSYTSVYGEEAIISGANVSDPGSYLVVRMWIQNTGSGLYWHTHIADIDGDSYGGAVMNVWRLDKSQPDCTTNTFNQYPNVLYVTFIGTTGNYQICTPSGCVPGA
ncbi:MAG TPA: hypothetical protein VGY48_02970 [Vicinamibacterales bacterium]|jgi:hypothetical protein|nr:hypothetical protein [Vicinamibacterales bacterium]